MEPKLYECECGSTLFSHVIPHQFEYKDVINWNTFGLKAHSGMAAILICISCTKIHVPPASFAGKSLLDPNVAAYGQMLKAIEKHNKGLEDVHVCGCKSGLTLTSHEVGKAFFNHPKEEEEYMGKLDKQTNPTKHEIFEEKKASPAPKSKEPRNKTKNKNPSKVKKVPTVTNGTAGPN